MSLLTTLFICHISKVINVFSVVNVLLEANLENYLVSFVSCLMCFLLKYCLRIYTTIALVSLFLLFVANFPKERRREILPVAEDPGSRVLSAEEQRRLAEQEENILRELRLFLRDVTKRLATDKRFNIFSKPVDIEEV